MSTPSMNWPLDSDVISPLLASKFPSRPSTKELLQVLGIFRYIHEVAADPGIYNFRMSVSTYLWSTGTGTLEQAPRFCNHLPLHM